MNFIFFRSRSPSKAQFLLSHLIVRWPTGIILRTLKFSKKQPLSIRESLSYRNKWVCSISKFIWLSLNNLKSVHKLYALILAVMWKPCLYILHYSHESGVTAKISSQVFWTDYKVEKVNTSFWDSLGFSAVVSMFSLTDSCSCSLKW